MNPPQQPTPAPSRKNCLLCLGACAGVIVLVPISLILLTLFFYVEEDWRGARAWEQAQAGIEAEGESVDPAKFVPAAVPDAKNFGALPYFKVVTVPGGKYGVELKRFAICQTLKGIADQIAYSPDVSPSADKLPFLGNWQKGQPADAYNFTGRLRALLKREQPDVTAPDNASPFEIFERACPVIADLRAAEATHPQCLFPEPIDYREPWKQSFGTDTSLLSLDKVLLYDARLALLENRTDIALEDFRVGWRVAAGVQKRPYFISDLVAAGIVAFQLRVIQQSLATHVWNDAQLTALEDDLEKINFLAQSRRQINGEIACYSMPMIDFYATHRGKWSQDTATLSTMFGDDDPWRGRAFEATCFLIPRGWFDLAKADGAQRRMTELRRIDLVSYQVHPEPDPEKSSDPALRWLAFILPDLDLKKGIEKKVAFQQVQLDEATISCRLERYWLAHRSYPATLYDLTKAYGSLPHDLMNGEPYRYRLNPNQTYILYSVGWNQVDDHGDAGTVRTAESPDWIWTNYPDQK